MHEAARELSWICGRWLSSLHQQTFSLQSINSSDILSGNTYMNTLYNFFFENRWALRNILNRASVLWSVCLGGTVVKYLWVMDSVFCQVVTSGFYFDWLLSQAPYFLRPYLSGFKIELQSVTVLADWMSISTAWSCGLMLEHRSDPHLHPSQATVRLSVTLELQRKPRPDLSIFLIRHILLGFFAFLLKTTSKHN